MDLELLRRYWRNERPYCLASYRRDAEELLRERLEYLRSLETPQHERFAKALLRGLTGSELADPSYAAQWSALARRRYCGVLLSSLYFVASVEHLDMTAVLAQRLLQGFVGRSVSNRVLIRAFGQGGRTAADKSSDWDQMPVIVESYRSMVVHGLLREKDRMRVARDAAWSVVSNEPRR
jgi:hypothetical protein